MRDTFKELTDKNIMERNLVALKHYLVYYIKDKRQFDFLNYTLILYL